MTDTNEHIVVKLPDTSANNLILGTIYVDLHGKCEVLNLNTGEKCELTCFRRGWTMANAYKVEGHCLDASGEKKFFVYGLWSEQMNIRDLSTGKDE